MADSNERVKRPRATPVQLDVLRLNILQVLNIDHVAQKFSARLFCHLRIPSGALDALAPQDFLLETVLPGLVEALAELYTLQPGDPYRWLSHWLATSAPPPKALLEDWPEPMLGGRTLKADERPGCHASSLGTPL